MAIGRSADEVQPRLTERQLSPKEGANARLLPTCRIAALSVAAALAAFGSTLAAQGAVAELRGRVVDESGAALPGATLTVTHRETGACARRSARKPERSCCRRCRSAPTTCASSCPGFSTLTQQNLRLGVGESANLTFTLNLATVQENITVTGETPLVDVKQSSIAGRVGTVQVEALPLNGRNWLDLVALVPGARGNPGNIQAGASGSDMAKYNVDGVDITNQCCGGANTGYSQENIAEFQVLTNRFDAEYGRVNGAVINAVTKSGTNQLRATGFGYFRNDRFDAKNPFTNRVAVQREAGRLQRRRTHRPRSRALLRQLRVPGPRHHLAPNTGFAQFDVDVPQDVTRHYVTGRADVQLNTQHRLFVRGRSTTGTRSTSMWMAARQSRAATRARPTTSMSRSATHGS